MKISPIARDTTVGLFTPAAMMFLNDSINTMIPWLFTMFAVIVCDLIAGVRKSMKLGIHVSPSRAVRETLGKMVTYFAWVLAVCMIDAAVSHSLGIAKWGCLLVCFIEGISIIGNYLKPHGYDFSVKDGIVLFLSRVFGGGSEEMRGIINDEHVDIIKQRERAKWGDVERKKTGGKDGK